MRLAKGPRPWAIHGFAVLLAGAGLWTYVGQMLLVAQQSAGFQTDLPGGLGRDAMIVVLSAQFTIVLIPVIAVWLFASRIARWIITAFSLWSIFAWSAAIWGAEMAIGDKWLSALWAAPSLFAWLLLFTPAANSWFKGQRTPDVSAFE